MATTEALELGMETKDEAGWVCRVLDWVLANLKLEDRPTGLAIRKKPDAEGGAVDTAYAWVELEQPSGTGNCRYRAECKAQRVWVRCYIRKDSWLYGMDVCLLGITALCTKIGPRPMILMLRDAIHLLRPVLVAWRSDIAYLNDQGPPPSHYATLLGGGGSLHN
jgi:hypothetical protein